MKTHRIIFALLLTLLFSDLSFAQLAPGVYFAEQDDIINELKITDDYFVLSVYKSEPAEFIQTIGGFYVVEDDHIKVNLEFNSNYEKDSIREIDIPYEEDEDELIFKTDPEMVFEKAEANDQDLDGAWLFATRGPDTGQARRGESNPRKTLKLLIDDRFQWIAYHTESMKFSGTGGGSFISEDGEYVETIEFFSRDNDRVGAELDFEYELKGDDWHHQGKNSKGEDMYEIWSKR